MKIIPYSNELKNEIKRLNIEWLEKYFSVENNDVIQLSDPENEIINKGGLIYYISLNDEIIGTATLMKIDGTTYELGKMAVSENNQGTGIGKKLLEHCISESEKMNLDRIVLYSNTILESAIHLYKKYGFTEVEMDKPHYKRANIKMELNLKLIE